MADYLLDSNHLCSALRKVSPRCGSEFTTTAERGIASYLVILLCELEVGIQQTPKPEDNRRRLAQLLRHVRLWPLDTETARLYGTVFIELRNRGRVLSQVDMVLAALARQHKLIVLTADQDFAALTDLRLDNWLV
jgi:tRNA(fMet)-specific endonuclease VapC